MKSTPENTATIKINPTRRSAKVKIKYDYHDWSVIEVQINNSDRFVRATAKTFMELMTLGLNPVLFIDEKDGYVYTKNYATARKVALQRLLANANSRQMVITKDGDQLNLTDDNLILVNPKVRPLTMDRDEHLAINMGLLHNLLDVEWNFPEMKQIPFTYTPQADTPVLKQINQL